MRLEFVIENCLQLGNRSAAVIWATFEFLSLERRLALNIHGRDVKSGKMGNIKRNAHVLFAFREKFPGKWAELKTVYDLDRMYA